MLLMILTFLIPFPLDYYLVFCLFVFLIWNLVSAIVLRDGKRIKISIFSMTKQKQLFLILLKQKITIICLILKLMIATI